MWIYKITNKASGKVYVGKTSNLEERWKDHRRGKGCGAIQKAIKKYGTEAFSFEILQADVQSEEELSRLEIEWIARLQSHGSLGGYNMTLGGEGSRLTDEMKAIRRAAGQWPRGRKVSDEVKALWSAQRRGKRPSDQCIRLGREASLRPKSEEHRKKIGDAHRGRKLAETTKAKLSQAHTKPIFYEGKSLSVTEWSKVSGVGVAALRWRLAQGWPMERALRPGRGAQT